MNRGSVLSQVVLSSPASLLTWLFFHPRLHTLQTPLSFLSPSTSLIFPSPLPKLQRNPFLEKADFWRREGGGDGMTDLVKSLTGNLSDFPPLQNLFES